MKKIFTLIAAAMMAVGVNAQTALNLSGDGWHCTFTAVAPTVTATYNFKNAYGSVELSTEAINVADYPSYELVLADDAPYSDLQFYINYDTESASGEQGWSGALGSGSPSAFIPEGAVKINSLQLQACNKENLGNVTIKSFYLIDKDGKKVATTLGQPASWSAPLLATAGTASFTGQWGQVKTTGAEGLSNQTVTVTSSEPFPSEKLNVRIETTEHNGDEGAYYRALTPGETSFSTNVETVAGETIKSITLQYAEDPAGTLPLDVKISSITVTDYTADAISEVSAAPAAQKVVKAVKNGKVVIVKNGAEYNVAGQLVK